MQSSDSEDMDTPILVKISGKRKSELEADQMQGGCSRNSSEDASMASNYQDKTTPLNAKKSNHTRVKKQSNVKTRIGEPASNLLSSTGRWKSSKDEAGSGRNQQETRDTKRFDGKLQNLIILIVYSL
jgi:hypothetical protein